MTTEEKAEEQDLTSETFARGGQQQTTAGSVLIVVMSCLAAFLVVAGLFYAAGTGGRHKAALAAAGCEPNLSPSGLPCTTMQMLVSRYTAIATPTLQQLSTDVAAYTASERHRLGAAEAALLAEVTSENAFDTSMARFPFPPAVMPIAKALIRAMHAVAVVTAQQARSSSLFQMRSFNEKVQAASTIAQTDLKLIRMALGTPPTASQEP